MRVTTRVQILMFLHWLFVACLRDLKNRATSPRVVNVATSMSRRSFGLVVRTVMATAPGPTELKAPIVFRIDATIIRR
jgi:hypothetical protein